VTAAPVRGPTIEQVSEDASGVRALVTFGHAPLAQGWGLEPQRVQHAGLGLSWLVTEVLDSWEAEDYVEMRGQPDVTRWWRLKVYGPLPGKPTGTGEFVMEVSAYGDRPGWWIAVEWPSPRRPTSPDVPSMARDHSPAR
jgi:hypothetical protein